MEQLITILKTILPVLALLTVGTLCKRWNILTQQGVDGIKSLVIKVMLPIVQFRAFSRIAIGANTLLIAVGVFIVCILGLLAGTLVGKVFRKADPSERFLYTSYEVGMIGYALYIVLFGADKISNFATVALGQEIFVFLILLPVMQVSEGKKPTVRETLFTIVKTPILVAILAGLLFSVTGLSALLDRSAAGPVIDGVLEFASAPTAALMLIVIGFGLDFGELDLRYILRTVLGRASYMALACFALVSLLRIFLPMEPEFFWAFVIFFLLPPSYIIPFFVKPDSVVRKISTYLSIYTVLTIAAFFGIVVLKTIS